MEVPIETDRNFTVLSKKERRDGAYEMEEPIKRRQDFTISKLTLIRDGLVMK